MFVCSVGRAPPHRLDQLFREAARAQGVGGVGGGHEVLRAADVGVDRGRVLARLRHHGRVRGVERHPAPHQVAAQLLVQRRDQVSPSYTVSLSTVATWVCITT